MVINPEMDISLLNEKELTLVHLFCHNSYPLSHPKYSKDILKSFHNGLVQEFKKRAKNHYVIDFLDKVYK